MTSPHEFGVDVGSLGSVTARHYAPIPAVTTRSTLVLAPGAGAAHTSGFMTAFATGLAARHIDVVTFNFVYLERGRRAPDPRARLERCYRAAIDTTRRTIPSARRNLFVGGKSMGGRIASQVVAEAEDDLSVAGLVFLGYPLHPPGRPERRRDAHLPQIAAPMLFVQGSRDTFGTETEIQSVVDGCANARLLAVAGGDHSLKVRGPSAPPEAQTFAAVQDTIASWITDRHDEN